MVKKIKKLPVLPVLPLRDVVIFPYMVIPLYVGRPQSIAALEHAMSTTKQVFLLGQKDSNIENPEADDLFNVGTIATVLQMLKLPDGTVKLLVEGLNRAKLIEFVEQDDYLAASIESFEDNVVDDTPDIQLKIRTVLSQFEKIIELTKNIPDEIISSIASIQDPGRLADSVSAHLSIKIEMRQKILDTLNVCDRLDLLNELLAEELELLAIEKRIQGRVKTQVEKNQRQYYLSEKVKAIQKEMGELDETGEAISELQQLEDNIKTSGMSKEAKEKSESELAKLKLMSPLSAEATVSRNYLDTMLSVPWKKSSKISHDLIKAKEILDRDHYGLEKVKERILEYLAVQLRVKKLKGPIICLVGPPGVGKTSLGQSIAAATGRRFARISLGGVRDEAEIRGHRRTYIGAMPGKIIQKLSKCKVKNPLFMLDEVDKMASDFRGDPAAALLEVLDPEQNDSFNDHYLEVDYNLSDVMFIATSNSLNIPGPLLDRMEVIHLAGYTEHEKLMISKNYLISRQMERNGLTDNEIKITDGAIKEIIQHYTREAGVRNLERDISKICRKVVHHLDTQKDKKKMITVTMRNVEKYLGVKKFRFGLAEEESRIGQVTGLAWTEVGGELLTIEAQVVKGTGKSVYTGRLGDVMQESIQAAMTVVRSRAEIMGIDDKCFQENDFHVHVPEGATPKDGPSAGVGMCTSLVSAITKIPVRYQIAMTGEITLRGEVLPIGGLKEKLLAALRGGITEVIIPHDNERDLKEIPREVIDELTIHPVRWIDEVFELALESIPLPISKTKKSSKRTTTKVVTTKRKSSRSNQNRAH